MVVIDMSHYKAFKQKVVEKLIERHSEKQIVEQVLPYFEVVIGSKRSYETIKQSESLLQLFEILEFRDEISANNIEAIKKIVRLAGCPNVVDLIISQYEKLQPQEENCSQCGQRYQPEEQVKPVTIHPFSQCEKYIQESTEDSESEGESELDVAIQKTASKIGRKWTDVARSLKLNEGEIDEIDVENHRLNDKIHKMFLKWIQKSGQKANVNTLYRAFLKSRRRDLADAIKELR